MSKFKIGLYCGKDKKNNYLILTLKGGHLSFEYYKPKNHDEETFHRYDLGKLGTPVVIKDDAMHNYYLHDNDAEIEFLERIEIFEFEQYNDGYRKGFLLKHGDKYSYGRNLVELHFDGANIFESKEDYTPWELDFFDTIISHHIAERKLKEAERNQYFPTKEYEIKKMKEYVDSIDLNSILSDLKVYVEDHFAYKRGDDDRYSIYRTAYVSAPIVSEDTYLQNIIGIGKRKIYNERGYGLKIDEYPLPNQPLGEYSGETLEHEKERILSLYSKEIHMGFVVLEKCRECERNKETITFWKPLRRKWEEKLLINYRLREWFDKTFGFTFRRHEPTLVEIKSKYSGEYSYSMLNELNKEIERLTPIVELALSAKL